MDHFRAGKRVQPEEEVPEPIRSGRTRRARGDALDRATEPARADRNLSDEQQQVLTLKFVFNFSNAEVATILGKTEGAVKSLQHRALVAAEAVG